MSTAQIQELWICHNPSGTVLFWPNPAIKSTHQVIQNNKMRSCRCFSQSKLNSNVGNGHESVKTWLTNLVDRLVQIRSLAQAIKTWNGVAAKTPSERCSITIQNQQDTPRTTWWRDRKTSSGDFLWFPHWVDADYSHMHLWSDFENRISGSGWRCGSSADEGVRYFLYVSHITLSSLGVNLSNMFN